MTAHERQAATRHDRLSIVRPERAAPPAAGWPARLERAVAGGDVREALRVLCAVVPGYVPGAVAGRDPDADRGQRVAPLVG
jgi:hypothetical protein